MKPLGVERPAVRQEAAAPAIDLSSSVTILQTPKDRLEPKKSRGKSLAFVGAAVLLLALVVVGVGGYFAVSWLRARPDDSSTKATGKGKTAADGTESATAVPVEFGRYWLEVLPNALAAEPLRVAGSVPLESGQAFKFHLELGENGYIYIVGPGERNQPTAFLTDKPAPISGLETNQVTKGSDFSFPSGIEHWLELDKKPGTENYTIIFSPTQLPAPAFLSSQATGKPLSETEQAEWSEFLAANKASIPVTEINGKDAAAPFVAIKVPKSDSTGSGAPVIFEVRIQHK
jgi:hypothetical protein